MNNLLVIDTHVHYYPFCELSAFFDAAHANMKKAVTVFAGQKNFTAVLCLQETATSHRFEQLSSIAKSSEKVGSWEVIKIVDENLLKIKNEDKEIIIVPGQQIITSENLELLIIGTSQKINHKKSIETYLRDHSGSRLVIIPWGVGKWLGNRGKIVSRLIDKTPVVNFALGDNSGRPGIWNKVKQFDLARNKGINVLPGSDPLPVEGQHRKVACYGSIITKEISLSGFVSQIRSLLLDGNQGEIKSYGRRDSFFNFMTSQLLLRLSPIKDSQG